MRYNREGLGRGSEKGNGVRKESDRGEGGERNWKRERERGRGREGERKIDSFILTIEPDDYTQLNIDLVFDGTTSRACGQVPIADDDRPEPTERFNVTITSDDPSVMFIPPPVTTVTIVDNDGEITKYSFTRLLLIY